MCTSRRANCALVGPSVCEMSTAQDAVLAVGKGSHCSNLPLENLGLSGLKPLLHRMRANS